MRRSTSFCLWYQIRNRSTSVLPAFQPKIYRSQNEFPKVVSQDINQKLTSNYEKDIASDELLLLSKYYFDGEVSIYLLIQIILIVLTNLIREGVVT